MKKYLFAVIIGSVLLLTGCKDSDINKAQDMISNGDYKSAVEILEKHSDDETAAPLLRQAQLEIAMIDAQSAFDAKDYSSAVSLLENYKDESKASELYNSAKHQIYLELLDGYWQNISGETLNGASVKLQITEDEGVSELVHSVENYYGYESGDSVWKNINVSAEGVLSMNVLKKNIDCTSEYVNVSAVLDTNDNTISFSDDFFGKWKKIPDNEAAAAMLNDPALTKTFDGTPIQSTDYAINYFGKRASELQGLFFLDTEYNYDLPYAFIDEIDYFDICPSTCIISKGGSFDENLYCGMTFAQIRSMENRGILTDFEKQGDLPDKSIYLTKYKCRINDAEHELHLYITIGNDDHIVSEIEVFDPIIRDENIREVSEWQDMKEQEEAQKRAEEEAKKDIAYSTDGLLYYFGSSIEFISSGNGKVAVCEPSMGSNLYLGNICFIENYSVLNSDLVMIQYGYLRETNRSVNYRGRTYPVYRAVKVIQ